jgi:hypothetical protein
VSQALATAVALVDELHSAPLDPQQAADMQARAAAAAAEAAVTAAFPPAAAAAADSSSSKGKGSRGRTKKTDTVDEPPAAAAAVDATPQADPSRVSPCGITVDVYWGDSSGSFYQLPATRLAATAAADLTAALPALATAKFDSLAAIAAHLKDTGAGAALSLLPGGALACEGQLAAACAAVGVPLAVQPPSSSSTAAAADGGSSKGDRGRRSTQQQEQQQQQGAPVLGGRSAVLSALQSRGYLTLPVWEVSRDEVTAARGEVTAWLEALQRLADGEEEGEGDPDDVSSSSSKAGRVRPVSPLLRAWTAARYDAAAAADVTSDTTAAEGEDSAANSLPALPRLAQQFAAWCEEAGLEPEGQLLSVSDGAGGELSAAVSGGARLLQQLVEMTEQGECALSSIYHNGTKGLHHEMAGWGEVGCGGVTPAHPSTAAPLATSRHVPRVCGLLSVALTVFPSDGKTPHTTCASFNGLCNWACHSSSCMPPPLPLTNNVISCCL